jgi:type III secretion protein S
VLLLSAPALLVAIVVGFGVGLFQALTQIQDQTLPQAVKLVAVLLLLIFAGPLLAGQVASLASQMLDGFAGWTR